MCCGDRRASLNSHAPAARTPRVSEANVTRGAAATGRSGHPAGVPMRYVGSGAFGMRGPRTGRFYAVPASGAVITVDREDADALVRTRLFRREAG